MNLITDNHEVLTKEGLNAMHVAVKLQYSQICAKKSNGPWEYLDLTSQL